MISNLINKSIALTLAFILLIAQSTYAVNYHDLNNHWAEKEILKWSEKGLIQGHNGAVNPNGKITRAEMAVMMDRLMDYQVQGDNTYSDLDENWYTEAMLKNSKAGIFKGHKGSIRPKDNITRQEAIVVLARVLKIDETAGETPFHDNLEIQSWAKGYVNTFSEKVYLEGIADGYFKPTDYISRSEVIKLVDNIVGEWIHTPGSISGSYDGTLIISTPNVTLNDSTINGDLIIAEGVADGEVTMNNVVILGNTTIKGGGENSVYFNNVQMNGVLNINKDDGKIRVVVSGRTSIKITKLESGAILVEENLIGGGFEQVLVPPQAAKGNEIIIEGHCASIDIANEGIRLKIGDNAQIDKVHIDKSAENTSIYGKGQVALVETEAKNTMVLTPNTKVELKEGANRIDAEGTRINQPTISGAVTPQTGGSPSSNSTNENQKSNDNDDNDDDDDDDNDDNDSNDADDDSNNNEPTIVYPESLVIQGETTVTSGASTTLTPLMTPSNASNKTIIWSSDNTSVAIVSNGEVTGVGIGTSTIRAITHNNVVATIVVTVKEEIPVVVYPTSLTLTGSKTVTTGASTILTATVSPSNATDKSIRWSSDNTSVATVTGGVVTGIGEGAATITATTHNNVKAYHGITVPAISVTDLAVKTQPVKTTYWANETLDLSGLVATLTYSDSSIEDVPFRNFASSGISVNPSNGTVLSTTSASTVVVSANGQRDSFDISIAPVTVAGIEIKTLPAKVVYWMSETLDLTGLVATLTYSNSQTEDIALKDFTDKGIVATPSNGAAFGTTGASTIVIAHGSHKDNFDVTANAVTISTIEVKTEPSKTSYWENEALDLTGLTATISYSNGVSENVLLADFASKGIHLSIANGTTLTSGSHGLVLSLDGQSDIVDITATPFANMTLQALSDEVVMQNHVPTQLDATPSQGDGGYTYQWKKANDMSKTGAQNIVGATNRFYTPATDSLGTFYYYCSVTEGDGDLETGETNVMALSVQGMTGAGTSADPFMIMSVEDLFLLGKGSSGDGKNYGMDDHYALGTNLDFTLDSSYDAPLAKDVNDIDEDSNTLETLKNALMATDGGKGFEPIGDIYSPFKGSFDGKGHFIRHLYINRTSDYIGLFGIVACDAIKDLGLEDVNIKGDKYIGGLLGCSISSSSADLIISNCYVTGTVSGDRSVGGLIGALFSARANVVENCYSTAHVIGNWGISGIVNTGEHLTIRNSMVFSERLTKIPSTSYLGRIVSFDKGTLENNYANSNMLIGPFGNEIIPTTNIGQDQMNGANIDAMVDGTNPLMHQWDFENIWVVRPELGRPTLRGSYPDDDSVSVWLTTNVLSDYEVATNSMPINLTATPARGDGTYTYQWKQADDMNKTNGQDIVGATSEVYSPPLDTVGTYYYYCEITESTGDLQVKETNVSTITLKEPKMTGWGSLEKPFVIMSIEDLLVIGSRSIGDGNYYGWKSHYKLGRDLDFNLDSSYDAPLTNNLKANMTPNDSSNPTNEGFIPIGWDNRNFGGFKGTFDGDGYVIKNLYVNRMNQASFFYKLTDGTIKGLGIENANIITTQYSGILAYSSSGTIEDCYTTGSITAANSKVGGLVASNQGTIKDCYSTATVTGNGYSEIGGLASTNSGTIKGSYAIGSIVSASNCYCVGGLAGKNSGTIVGSFSAGSMKGGTQVGTIAGLNQGTIDNCYSTTTINSLSGNYAMTVGGIAGYNSGFIKKSYSIGDLVSSVRIGGITGQNSGTIENTIAFNGVLTCENMTNRITGGHSSDGYGTLINNYANSSMSLNFSGGSGPNDKNGQDMNDNDFKNLTSNNPYDTWTFTDDVADAYYWKFSTNRPLLYYGNGDGDTSNDPQVGTDDGH